MSKSKVPASRDLQNRPEGRRHARQSIGQTVRGRHGVAPDERRPGRRPAEQPRYAGVVAVDAAERRPDALDLEVVELQVQLAGGEPLPRQLESQAGRQRPRALWSVPEAWTAMLFSDVMLGGPPGNEPTGRLAVSVPGLTSRAARRDTEVHAHRTSA